MKKPVFSLGFIKAVLKVSCCLLPTCCPVRKSVEKNIEYHEKKEKLLTKKQ